MTPISVSATTGRRAVVLLLAAAALAGLALLPSSASASGCTNSWSAKGSGSWYVAANWSKKAVPTSEEEVCITENGSASYTVEMDQGASVSLKSLTIGGSEHTQTLVVASTNSANAQLTTTAGITTNAHGAMTLTNAETSGNNVDISGPIANGGTITSEPAHGGQRVLQGNLTNTGTLAINANTIFDAAKSLLTNEGTVAVATAVSLNLNGTEAAFTNASGKIEAGGTGFVNMEPGTKFTQGAGTVVGSKPVILRQAALVYTGSGAGLITQHGAGGTLSGNLAAGQKLVLESTNGENVTTTASASFTNAGSITLTNIETSANNATLAISAGTLTNSGTITTEKVDGGARVLQGNLTNTGTLTINLNTTFNATKATLLNEGTVTIATGNDLNIDGTEASFVNKTGVTEGVGSGFVEVEPGDSFTQGAGTVVGSKPVILRQAALVYTGSGAGLITQHGAGGTLSGNLSSGQKLVLESTNGENVSTTASASFTNAGSITLTNIETSANNATLVISSGTLTNSGTITTEKAVGGARVLQGNITNMGTLAVNLTTTFNGSKATLLNEGTVTIATGTDLNVDGTEASFVNKAGVTEGVGSGFVEVEPGDSFTQGAGTVVGSKPVILRDAALNYTGSGAGLITQHGAGGTLSGNLAAGQKLVLESTNGENVSTTASASFTNAGSITLTNIETSANNATLAISAGTLTNSGTITTEKAVGGARNLDGNITNKGTLAINANTSFAGSEAKLVNEGAINVAATVLLSSTGNQTIANETGGTINPAGSTAVVVNGGTFDQGLGKTPTSKTTEPVIVDNGTLSYTGKGASRISIHGTSSLTGEVAKGQTLLIQSTNSQNATVTAGNVLVDSGTIELTNFETSANDVVLRLGSEGTGTLENKGKLEILFPEGGTRTIEGNLVNDKTLTLANGTQPLSVQGAFTLGTKASVKTTIAGSGNYGRVSATGAVTLAGKLTLKQLKFTGKAGETFAIFAGASRTGEFASIKGTAIKGGSLSYTPHYTATALDLVVE